MKKWGLYFMASLLGLYSCGGAQQKSDQEQSDSIVVTGVDEVIAQKAEEEMQDATFFVDLIAGWGQDTPMSAALQKAIKEVEDAATAAGSEVGYFDYDLWTESQDPDMSYYTTDVEVVSQEANEAVVKLNLVQYGEKSPRVLKLAPENDTWVISDFQGSDGKWILEVCAAAMGEIKKW